MDAPPVQEDCTPFIRVCGYLNEMQLNTPRIVEADVANGFLLLTDLGMTQYFDQLRKSPGSVATLYDDALHALWLMQNRGADFQSALPPYDRKLLQSELALFHDWLCETHLHIEFNERDEDEWQRLCEMLVSNALEQPKVFVHRDYHSRNLMVTERNNPGILDFQDAVEGPLTYDLVSLLKDCYLQWPAERVHDWALAFYAKLDEQTQRQIDTAHFMRYFDLMGVQRHLKAAGIFARLKHRDGKSGYLADVPATLQYIVELGSKYEELGFLVRLINERCLPSLRAAT